MIYVRGGPPLAGSAVVELQDSFSVRSAQFSKSKMQKLSVFQCFYIM